ncbi:hypothetical protein BZA77DRAFT_389102 [Pyronema omphalodes]|nr:hypothetical protein BZA77DRAFT_389102 [Pyronema omphalodes]
MGASQSSGRADAGPRPIPIRPRTPLQFGSVPTALPVDPSKYNTRPIRNLYPSISTADAVTSLLSQENYLCPTPLSEAITEEDFEDTTSPASWASPTRYYCPHASCSYSIIGFRSIEEVEYHMHTTAHITPQHQRTGYPQPVQYVPHQPPFMIPEHNCMCENCIPYQNEWSSMTAMHVISAPVSPLDADFHSQHQQHIHTQHIHYQSAYQQQQHHHDCHNQRHHSQTQPQYHQSSMMHPMLQIRRLTPMMGSYHGPEVEDIGWNCERLPKPISYGNYPMTKRQRLDLAFVH